MPPDDNEETAASTGPAEAVQEEDAVIRAFLRSIHSSIGRFLEEDRRAARPPTRIETGIQDLDSIVSGGLPLGMLTELVGVPDTGGRVGGVGAAFATAQEHQRRMHQEDRDLPTVIPAWYASRNTSATPTMRSVHLHGSAVDVRGPFHPPDAPANPGPVHFGTGIEDLPIVGLDEGIGESESHGVVVETTVVSPDYETFPLAVLDTPPLEPVQYIEWLHTLDQHTEWIRVSHGWTVRRLPRRVFLRSPTSPIYVLYHPRNRNQCPSAVQEVIATWLVSFEEHRMSHEFLDGFLTMHEGWSPVGESGEWAFHWNDLTHDLAVLHEHTGLYFSYNPDGDMPSLPFETANIAMGLHNRLHPRFVQDSQGREYVLTLRFDPPDVICVPPPVDPDDSALVEYMTRFRDVLDSLYAAPIVNFDPVTDVSIDDKPVEGQSRWTLVDEDHASE